MLLFQKGDERAFEELVRRHGRGILNLVYRYLGDAAAAEDAAQEVFVKVYRARKRYRPEARFSTWLYRIAVNHCLNAIRARRTQPSGTPPEDELVEGRGGTPVDAAMRREDLRREVKEAVDSLPEHQRMAVILARYHEMSYAEIAEAMKLSVEAVKSLLFRAKENLRLRLARYARDPGC